MIKYDEEYFKEKFPNLFKSIKNKKAVVEMDGVEKETKKEKEESETEETSKKPTKVTIIDYIRLCDEKKEALEIIDYMEDQGRIEKEHARKLKEKLEKKGLRSFGAKREPGESPYIEEKSE